MEILFTIRNCELWRTLNELRQFNQKKSGLLSQVITYCTFWKLDEKSCCKFWAQPGRMTGVGRRYYKAWHVSSWESIEGRPDPSRVDSWFRCWSRSGWSLRRWLLLCHKGQSSNFKIVKAVVKPGTEL